MATTVSLKPNAVEISGSTSGTTTLQATAVAGTTTLTLPAATDTLVGKATTDTLTNKTLTGAVMNGTLGATTPSTAAVTTLEASTSIRAGTTGASLFMRPVSATPSDGTEIINTFFTGSQGPLLFKDGTTTRMTLNASGDLGIGTTTPNIGGLTRVLTLNTPTGGNYSGVELAGAGTLSARFITNNTGTYFGSQLSIPLVFETNATERARFDTSGNFIAATSNATLSHKLSKGSALARFQLQAGESYPVNFYEGNAYGFSAAATLIEVSVNNVTSRSINAGGTINASGADYAEYMTKAGNFTIAKGDVVGIDAQGKLTNVFANAVSFVVKSTDPSYVGGDTWGSVDVLGQRPNEDATQEVKDAFNAALEAARQTVDRIAFAGQVPVNVTGATAGQYIIPVNDNGAIKGEAVSNPTFEQYQVAVGKVIAIESDGRAKIIVKVA